ncbi:Hint domain-containing protein [Bremerella sp. JC817]|uniref:Hint domain-containing protein n=1 Tax=Bremerella sp. JC817 TaxID=3231756 RepID=UPI003457AE21
MKAVHAFWRRQVTRDHFFLAGTLVARPATKQPIEQIPLGVYVHSLTAAERTEFGFDASWVSGIDAEDHRTVRLQLEKSGGGRVQIQLLRDVAWVEAAGCVVGETIFLNMPELGAEGIADVLAIEPCPPLETLPADCNPSQYRLVTGTIQHESGETLDLKLTSEPAPIGVTPSHPIWSVDQQDWINAADLKPGETVKTLTGTSKVETISEREAAEPVYNIEVEGDHVYRIGDSGVLVHNASSKECGLFGERFGAVPKYTTEAAGNSGKSRTTLMQARLTKDRIKNGEEPKVYPPGWPDGINLPGLTRIARGHILVNNLGGKGRCPKPCSDLSSDNQFRHVEQSGKIGKRQS